MALLVGPRSALHVQPGVLSDSALLLAWDTSSSSVLSQGRAFPPLSLGDCVVPGPFTRAVCTEALRALPQAVLRWASQTRMPAGQGCQPASGPWFQGRAGVARRLQGCGLLSASFLPGEETA